MQLGGARRRDRSRPRGCDRRVPPERRLIWRSSAGLNRILGGPPSVFPGRLPSPGVVRSGGERAPCRCNSAMPDSRRLRAGASTRSAGSKEANSASGHRSPFRKRYRPIAPARMKCKGRSRRVTTFHMVSYRIDTFFTGEECAWPGSASHLESQWTPLARRGGHPWRRPRVADGSGSCSFRRRRR